MEEKTKKDNNPRSSRWADLEEMANSDPELTKKLETAKRIIDRYHDALERLADS